MQIDTERRIKHGGAGIRETSNWNSKHPLGPVHWDVWNWHMKELVAQDIAANELDPLLVSKGLLVQW